MAEPAERGTSASLAPTENHFCAEQGVLSYRNAGGKERGREWWWMTANRDGTRTLRCLAMTDDSRFVRDATYTLGRDERMHDAFVRLQVGDTLVGTGYFRVEGSELRLQVDMDGRHEEQLSIGDRFHLITHAVMLDGWSTWPFGLERGGRQYIPVYNTSTRWDGTDGPLGRLEEIILEAQGETEIEVPAGCYPCRHFTIESEVLDVPTSHIYVTGPHNLLVRYSWPGLGLEYVLSEHSSR